jgi:hypothetical protein
MRPDYAKRGRLLIFDLGASYYSSGDGGASQVNMLSILYTDVYILSCFRKIHRTSSIHLNQQCEHQYCTACMLRTGNVQCSFSGEVTDC